MKVSKQIINRLANQSIQVSNIMDIFGRATPEEISAGKVWYQQANEIANLMAVKYNLSVPQCAGIISALSPGTSWSQNIIDANNFCTLLNEGKDVRSITVTTYGNNKVKAYIIYCSPELSEEEIYIALRGASKHVNKTSSFYMNILHPDRDELITIDRHSFRVNLGIEELIPIALTEKRYKTMAGAYKSASAILGYNAIELQAITWLVFRRLFITVRLQEFEESPF
jgi:hypothetical protein